MLSGVPLRDDLRVQQGQFFIALKLRCYSGSGKDAVSDTFQGIYAPAGTPQPVIDRLAKELALILNRPDIREKFVKAGLPVVAEGPEVFRARIAREVPMYKDIIDKAGLKIQ